MQLREGKVLCSVRQLVPQHWPQTAAAAERWALGMALELTTGKAHFVTDCASLVQSWPTRQQLADYGGAWSGVWRRVNAKRASSSSGNQGECSLECARAHQQLRDEDSQEAGHKKAGNAVADEYAKQAATVARATVAEREAWQAAKDMLQSVACAVASMIRLWPPPRALSRTWPRRGSPAARRPTGDPRRQRTPILGHTGQAAGDGSASAAGMSQSVSGRPGKSCRATLVPGRFSGFCAGTMQATSCGSRRRRRTTPS